MTDDKASTRYISETASIADGVAHTNTYLAPLAFYKRTSFARKRVRVLAPGACITRHIYTRHNIRYRRRWWRLGNRLKSEADSYGRTAHNSRYINDRLASAGEREASVAELESNNEYLRDYE